MIAFIGVRISCDILAKKADFNRSDCSALFFAISRSAVRSCTNFSRRSCWFSNFRLTFSRFSACDFNSSF